jgi:uncharacterized protein YndB with AHSA1/START domain
LHRFVSQEALMVQRQVVIPASVDQLWDALTDPDSLAAWFGSEVEWDLRPGGAARFREEDGTRRRGVVESVFPGRHLSFRWWEEDGGATTASQVSYTLEPDEEGTRLTVTEQPVDFATASASATGPAVAAAATMWTRWDTRLVRCWALVGSAALEPAISR